MTSPAKPDALGRALVEFTTNGAFPEEGISDLKLSSNELPPAIQALDQAKSNLEVCGFLVPMAFVCPHY